MRSWKSSNCSWEACGGSSRHGDMDEPRCAATCHAGGTPQCQACLHAQVRASRDTNPLCGLSLMSMSGMTFSSPPPSLKRTTSLHSTLWGGASQVLCIFLKAVKVHHSEAWPLPVALWFILTRIDSGWLSSHLKGVNRGVCVCLSGWITDWVYQAQAQVNVTVNVTGWKRQLKEVTTFINQIIMDYMHASFPVNPPWVKVI